MSKVIWDLCTIYFSFFAFWLCCHSANFIIYQTFAITLMHFLVHSVNDMQCTKLVMFYMELREIKCWDSIHTFVTKTIHIVIYYVTVCIQVLWFGKVYLLFDNCISEPFPVYALIFVCGTERKRNLAFTQNNKKK